MWFQKDKVPIPLKWKLFIVIPFISPVIFMAIYSTFLPPVECERSKEFRKIAYRAVISRKYRDEKNHGVKTIVFRQSETLNSLILNNDTAFYNYVEVGDSAIKYAYLNLIRIKRGNVTKQFTLNFGCKSSK